MSVSDGHSYLYAIQEAELLGYVDCCRLIGRSCTAAELAAFATKRYPPEQRTPAAQSKIGGNHLLEGWASGFLQRNGKSAKLAKLYSISGDSGRTAADPTECGRFFDDLRSFQADACASLPYNTLPPRNVFALTDSVFHCKYQSCDMRVWCCVRADGMQLPPFFLPSTINEPYDWNDMLRVARPSEIAHEEMDKNNWLEDNFLPFIKANNPNDKVLLLVRPSVDAGTRAALALQNVTILCLPEHTERWLHPLQQGILPEFHRYIADALVEIQQTVAHPPTPRASGIIAAQAAFNYAMKPAAIKKAFEITGICPIDQSRVQVQIDILRRLKAMEAVPLKTMLAQPTFTKEELDLFRSEQQAYQQRLRELETAFDEFYAPAAPEAKRRAVDITEPTVGTLASG